MSGGSRGPSFAMSQGNTEMGIHNERWQKASQSLRSIRELRKKKGSTVAELFRATGSREVRDIPEGHVSDAEILREFDQSRAEAGQTQATQLQGSHVLGSSSRNNLRQTVDSERKLLGGRYAHAYGGDAEGLDPDKARERDLLHRFRGDEIRGSGESMSSSVSENEQMGTATRTHSTSLRLIGSGREVTVGQRNERVMTADQKRRLKNLKKGSLDYYEFMQNWRSHGSGGAGGGVSASL